MIRPGVVLFLAGMLASNVALAQCRGGGGSGGGGTGGPTGTTGVASTAGLIGVTGGTTASLFTGPGSLAYDVAMSQLLARQMAQQQAMLAAQQQKLKAEKLAERKYRAEKTRAQVAESRARTRALLAAQSGLPAPSKPPATLVAYNSIKR